MDKPLPNNLNLESELIGTLINFTDLDFDKMYEIMLKIDSAMIYGKQNKQIIEFMQDKIINQKTVPDINVMLDRFKFAEQYIGAGSFEFKINDMIQELKCLYLRREMIISGHKLIGSGYDIDNYNTIEKLLKKVNSEASNVVQIHQPISTKTTSQIIKTVVDLVQHAATNEKFVVKSNIDFVDEPLNLFRGQIHTVGAFQGGGKTAFALHCMKHQILAGMKVVYFCTESRATEMIMRIIANEMQCEVQKLLTGVKKENTMLLHRLKRAVELFNSFSQNFKIYGSDDFPKRIDDIYSICAKFARESGPIDQIYLDYLQDLEPPLGERLDERQTIGYNAKGFKDICNDRDCVGMLLSQFNQETHKDKRPTKRSFRGSGVISDVSHAMTCLWEPPPKQENLPPEKYKDIWWYTVKTRLIKEFCRPLSFYGDSGRFFKKRSNDGHRYGQSDRPKPLQAMGYIRD